jgi:hypothetical protein
MKKIFLAITTILMSSCLFAQISAGQINDFQDGTTQGWSNGVASPNPPINIPDGGPNGAGDRFLREVSSGGSGSGSRLVVFNDENEWQGNYSAQNIVAITFHAKNSGSTDLSLRIAMEGGDDTSEMVTTQFVSLAATQTDWILISIPILASDFTVINGNNTAAEVLADMSDIRIISNPNAQYEGEVIDGSLDLDNITASTVLGTNENIVATSLIVSPNPVIDVLYVSAKSNLDSYRVYSITGDLVLEGDANADFTHINFSALSAGLYLLKVKSSEDEVIRKVYKR